MLSRPGTGPLIGSLLMHPASEISLYTTGKDGALTAIASTLSGAKGGGTEFLTGTAELKGALNGQRTIRRLEHDGRPKAVLVAGIPDYSGTTAAALEMMIDVGTFEDSLVSAEIVAGVAVVIALALAAGLLSLVHRTVTRPLVAITGVMESLAAGDTAVAVPPARGGDEVSQMARAVAVFKDGLIRADQLAADQRAAQEVREQRSQRIEQAIGAFDRAISSVVGGVTTAATQLQADAQSLSATADQANRQAVTVAAAAGQASGNVQTVAAATEELTASVGEISRQVGESARIASGAAEEANRTNQTIAGLSEAAQKIGEVVQLINGIASQTNLLALNATIEAARAGEAGKGFAVVAGEVKTLANQTARATDEIQAQVTQMQAVTNSAVEAIRGITGTIRRMSDISTTIASAVDQQGAATHEIARNVLQASHGTQEVSANIGEVTQAAASTGRMANQTLSAAQDLTRHASQLRSEVDGFIQSVRAA
ncbi:methyl-accepting chemotaxis protein [Azospirillaceae bacterium]